jgi:hypothetical protein
VSRLLLRCQGLRRGVEAAVKASRLLSRCQGRRQGVEAAVEMSKPPSRCGGRHRSVEAAVDVEATILEINATVEVKVVRFCQRLCAFVPLSRVKKRR